MQISKKKAIIKTYRDDITSSGRDPLAFPLGEAKKAINRKEKRRKSQRTQREKSIKSFFQMLK
jgi:hypothetical protein